ncbi:hypothetical protein HNV11_09230 [Spirosoma taeanense]|uniref:Tetratricopeptide repeat protein n=1 Tax=Spirosoma taeanense TaxID=2735870 RepID=A0A6M5Y4Y6_9BACT|nr:hypothetical protein [Spirosoma taeanense]QJW89548.1 hypothetical protein HNV11_09230 [Spirosoma taeanense]
MNTLETIENYLSGQLSVEERMRFEDALRTDPTVAEALAFYVTAKQAARQEAWTVHKAQADQQEAWAIRKAELDALRRSATDEKQTAADPVVRPLITQSPYRWLAWAASIVLLLGLGWYFLLPEPNTGPPMADATPAGSQLADQYMAQNFMNLPVTMGGDEADSLQRGIELFNQGWVPQAGEVFQAILRRQPNNDSALKYAGIVALRRADYDQAIDLFHRLSQQKGLFANPGTFYEAIARIKRGRPIDKTKAKELLNEVIAKNLDGKKEAERMLRQLGNTP